MKLFNFSQRASLNVFFEYTKLDLDGINISLFNPSFRYRNCFNKIRKTIGKRAKEIEKLSITEFREIGGYYLISRDRELSTLIETEGEKIRSNVVAGIPKFYASDGKPLLKDVPSLPTLEGILYVVDMHSHPFGFTPSDNDISFAIRNVEMLPPKVSYIQGICCHGDFLFLEVSK